MTIFSLTCLCDAIIFLPIVPICLEFLNLQTGKDADESIFSADTVFREIACRQIW